ncbi:alpha/beta fold hydrolase [Amycolatopsis sp. H20-H5]|uniref:alpha/beta fold hydrolase n=1 Tax=Amycolatopsis sp. H20-H5 TaxID=3046309 RepID=UPI002DB6A93E|nr:alpha/beta hydrolase [Amycolatopsis sp. H20-H5]MEC3980893.1 alpha/beta hydrolase [Amycolatopsis sp. H20-H5]
MISVHHRTATVAGRTVFYREAGPAQAPTIVLLHGFPTSSHMFRELIPALADRYHVLAPDMVGFGRSDAPAADEFDYSFDSLAAVTRELLDQLDVTRFALYVQDYGAPIGWRLALHHPDRVTAIVTQNGNGYTDGFVDAFWTDVWAYATNPGPKTEGAVRFALSLEAIRWQYVHGVPDPSLVSPDSWHHDHALVSREGNDEVQLTLFRDYPGNVELYPKLQEYFRTSQVPLLAVWGRNDEIFGPAGARAFARDLPDAEVHLLDGGHFLLESELDAVTGYLRGFLGRVLG